MVSSIFRRSIATLAAGLMLIAAPVGAGVLDKIFAPKPELWSRWTAHADRSKDSIDHGAWDRFLNTYRVSGRDGIARVAYGKVSDADRSALDAYLAELSAKPISRYSRAEQLAYWVNLYNALTVKTVLDHYPVKSIRDIDISTGLLADGPWGKKLIEVEGEPVSLDDIEHRILRPIWKDPRIHYAVNCASLGCPDLPRDAFTAGNTGSLLNRAARAYVNHPRGVRVSADRLTLSSIYSWFEADFAADGGVLAHLRRYADADLKAELEDFEGAQDYVYDWRLNDAGVR